MTQPLPITPGALTKRARTILGAVGPHSVKVRHMTDVVDVYIGDVHQSQAKAEEYGQRQRQLIEELTRQGYLAEPVGAFAVRVQRQEDVERKRQEMLAADAARLADIVPVQVFRGLGQQTVHWPEDTLDRIAASTGGIVRRLHAVYGVDRVTREAVCTCGVHLPEADIDQHVTTANAYEPEADIDAQDAQDDRVLAASAPDLTDDIAAVRALLPAYLGTPEHDELVRKLAADRQAAYVSGWNDGHDVGLAEADGFAREALVTLRKKVMEYRGHTFDTDPLAEA